MKVLHYNEQFYFTVGISRNEADELITKLDAHGFEGTRNDVCTGAPALRDITIFCKRGIRDAAIAQKLIESV